ncbi:DUF58 domain-containing protein [bacterium]|nr:DUF58 domain-containing protein [bacterium]
MTDIIQALEPAALARLANMELRARTIVEGHFSGQHHSHFKGASVEFADHRNYSPGDELRHLDWKLYGRTDRFFVKQYDAETNMSVMLVLDASGSMQYASGEITKAQYGSYLAAGLAYLTSRQGDAPGLALLDGGVAGRLMPRTRPAHLRRLWEMLEETLVGPGLVPRPGTSTDGRGTSPRPTDGALADSLAEVAAMLTRRGILVLISDLLEPPERLLRALRYFRHRGHDVVVLQVLDEAEVNFPFRGAVEFQDLESGQRLRTETADIRRSYLEGFRQHQETICDGCRSAGLDYELMLTTEPFGRALTAYLGRRMALS